ncbi:MAG: cytochrome c oxidase assembly protein [Gammaproteobacteria bacterium]|nr:cytochrome c oxidase assembly protein [Gammaproteobacteria bacterium]
MSDNKSHKKIFWIGGIVAALMFGFCFAMVPLYSVLCRATGINQSIGTNLITAAQADEISKEPDLSRTVVVQFTSTNHMGMPWDFYPKQLLVKVHPGEKKQIYFYAKNPTKNTMIAQAIPSMTPVEAISHFHKIECFCFNQQTLAAGESRNMGMLFQIDKDIPKDVHVITLAYTLFDATPKKDSRKG